MIDPNKGGKVVFQNNPLYEAPDTSKTTSLGKSQSSDVRQVEPQVIIPKKKGSFAKLLNSLMSKLPTMKSTPKVVDAVKFMPLAGKLSVEVDKFDPTSLSKSDLLSSSYTMLKRAADKTDTTNVEGFQRGNDISSKIRAELGKNSKIADISKGLKKTIEDQPVAVDKKGFQKLVDRFGEIDPEMTRGDIAKAISSTIDTTMSKLFGIPGDLASTKNAAKKYPQQLCDLLAIQFKAIENSDAPDNLKSDMKHHLARDVLALRSLNPELVRTVSKMSSGMERDGLLQLSKAIQSLVNGQGLSQNDLPPDMKTENEFLKDRWADQFLSFTEAILARADEKTVAKHVQIGSIMVDHVT